MNHRHEQGVLVLERDNWDDYGYKTTFSGFYNGEFVGAVKISYMGMTEGEDPCEKLPREFEMLPDNCFSLWQSEIAYEKLRAIEVDEGDRVFEPLRDIAFDTNILERFFNEPSLQISLLRSVSAFACKGQLHRIATGGKKLIEYHFSFTIASCSQYARKISLSFDVVPHDYPPSNIHALIGRNGIGKTKLIQDFACCICGQFVHDRMVEENGSSISDNNGRGAFANVLCVSFGPFDDYSRVLNLENEVVNEADSDFITSCHYIGLDKTSPNLLSTTEDQFVKSYIECLASERKRNLWNHAVEYLKSDLAFAKACGSMLPEDSSMPTSNEDLGIIARETFSALSSGHKVVLAIITSCVNWLEEQSIVFVDEPENHLHPPLLAALIRALSYLLIDRNSVAVIATHSPVVLQEIPRSCVWMLNRFGDHWRADRPGIETFGSDFESLTSQVFGYEVQSSGFHKMLQEAVDKSDTLESAIEQFRHQLGTEANALIRVLWAQKNRISK